LNLLLEWLTFKGVILRHFKEFVSYRASVVATIVWPLPLLALNVYQYLGLASGQQVNQVLSAKYGVASFSGMIILGTIVYLLYNRMLWGTGASLQEERFNGTIECLFLTPANRMTVLVASGFSSLLEGSWWIVGVFVLSWVIFGVQPAVVDWAAVIVALVSTMIALVAVGVFFASFFVLTRAADQLATSLQAPIRYASGVAFPVAALPAIFQLFAYILPVTYGIDALRRTVVQQGTLLELVTVLAPLYLFTALLIVAGHFLLKRVEAQAKRTGSLYKI
jgi:ABC-2 type transport system permease protein